MNGRAQSDVAEAVPAAAAVTDYGVVTICLNAAPTITRAMDSVFAQVPAPRRYVLVDGGSSDGTTTRIAARFEQAHAAGIQTECRLLAQRGDGGIPAAWNQGIRDLHGDLVFLLNADDWYEPGAAAAVTAAFAVQPHADLLIGPIRVWRGSRPSVVRPRPFWLLPVLMPVMHPGCFVHRRAYERVGLFDTRYRISADYDFVYRCFAAGLEFRRYARPLVNMQAGGAAGRNRALARRETAEIAARHCRVPLLPHVAAAARAVLGR